MVEAIRKSGYLIEQRVAGVLAKHGYYVETNPAYPDPETGKSREYDISAMAGVRIAKKRMDFIFPVVVSECENNEHPVVFFSTEPPVPFLHHQEVKCSGVPVQFWDGQRFVRLSDFLHLEKYHHYCKGPVATQYCSFHRKSNNAPWIASHSDAHHQTFNSLINALETSIAEHYESWAFPSRGEEEPVNLQVYYPVLILQGELYVAQERGNRLIIRRSEHVQYRKQLWSARIKNTYQFDIVTLSQVPRYLELVDSEIEAMKRRLQRHNALARNSINRLVANAARVRRKKINWRQVFEPQ